MRDLAVSPEVARLGGIRHHLCTDRLEHSLNVAYLSFKLCTRLGLDSRSAARGALLHDLYFSDPETPVRKLRHLFSHPAEALENAENCFSVSERERDIILKHMWPLTERPVFAESWIVTFADKISTLSEISNYFSVRHRKRASEKL